MTEPTAATTTDSTAALQRRTLGVLFLASIGARASGTLTFTVASLAVLTMIDGQVFAGLPTVATTLGTAVSAKLLSGYMAKRGRRPGLALGFSIGSLALILTAVGVQQRSLALFLAGLVFFGVGQGSANLARYAAADLAETSNRGKAISFIVFASTIGAVGGPLLIGPAERMAASFDNGQIIGPYIAGAACTALAALIIFIALRPDPLVVSGGLAANKAQKESGPSLGLIPSLKLAWSHPGSRLALVGMISAQMVMVMVMVMTPAHMKAHDHEQSVVGWVISVHTAGMFMFAPLAGWLSDRFGRVQIIMQGGAVLAAATIVTALAGEAPRALLFPGLFLLGLGWSLILVSASALLTESVDEEHRVPVQGTADLFTSGTSGLSALAAGFVFDAQGYHSLSLLGTAIAAGVFVMAFTHYRLGHDS